MDRDAEYRMSLLEKASGSKKDHGQRGGMMSLKAPFGWAGSKQSSLKNLLLLVPYTERYCEVFGGSAALLLARDPVKFEIYNDRHSGLVDFWISMRDNKEELMDRISETIYSRELWEHYADTWERMDERLERAVRWYYMTAYSFSQLGRHWGRSLTPQGNLAGKIKNRFQDFGTLSDRLQRVTIENLDWRQMLADYDHPTMTFYLDPPYIETPSGTYSNVMTIDDHVDLLATIPKLKATVVLSGYHNELIDEMDYWTSCYEWSIREQLAPKALSYGNRKTEIKEVGTNTEVIWIKEAK